MEEEFQFSELIFPENEEINNDVHNFSAHDSNNKQKREKKKNKKRKNSVPVNIPEIFPGKSWFQCVESEFLDDGDVGGEVIPPHLILGRRLAAGKMAFSVCTGNGRTLKGRDLSEVRNSILRMTGFVET